MSLLLRTNGKPQNVFASARKEILSIDPETPIYAVTSMDNLISNAPATFIRRYPAYLITLFAAVAFLLATIGIYGVIAYSVGERVREIAIRVVLGAQDRDILSLIIRQGMLPAIIGVAVGLAGSLALTRVISSLLFGVSSWDPLTYLVVAVTLLVVAVFACYLPARKALRINPNFALRYE